jgi:hypothetical protein
MIILREKEYSTPTQKAIYGVVKGVNSSKRSVGKTVLEGKIKMRNVRLRNKRTSEQLNGVADRARQMWNNAHPEKTPMQQKRLAIKVNNRITTKNGWVENGKDIANAGKQVGNSVAKGAEKLAYETGPTINKGISKAIQNPGLAVGAVGGKVAAGFGDVVTPYTGIGAGLDKAINLIPGAKMGKIHARQGYQRSNVYKDLDNWSILKK